MLKVQLVIYLLMLTKYTTVTDRSKA